jgi:hypothetical protein
MRRWTFKNFKNYPLIFSGPLKFLNNPLYTLIISHFYWVAAIVDISCIPTHTYQSPTVTGVALDIIGICLVQLFHHTKIGRFLLWTLESDKRDTSRLPFISSSKDFY